MIDLEEEARHSLADRDSLVRALNLFELPAGVLNLRSWEISQGMRQRFEIAKALSFKPDVLLLDEAFSGIDVATKRAVFTFLDWHLTESPISLLFVTHDLGDVMRLADTVSVMRDGEMIVDLDPELPRAERLAMNGGQLIDLPATKELGRLLF